jgi:hypothetical protein
VSDTSLKSSLVACHSFQSSKQSRAVVLGGPNRKVLSAEFDNMQGRQQLPGLVEVSVAEEALQHLG